MPKLWRYLLPSIFLGLLAACAAATPRPASPARTLALSECQLSAPGLAAHLEAQCGTLLVPEDRATANGRQIALNVAVIPAVSRSPAPDPLFILTGGPGQAATESYLQLASAFERINQKRDIVLVDQRGTGQSNPLRCSADDDDADFAALPAEQQQARQTARLQACRAALEPEADLRLYTTAIAMADLEAVRVALGYDLVNLYGVSYGTRAAQTYMKLYPEHLRAVILDGVVPQTDALGLYVARDAQRALDLIFTRCAAQADCAGRFPNLRADFEAVLSEVAARPIEIPIKHPLTGRDTPVTLTRDDVALTVRFMSYAPEQVALLPLLLHTAAQGDYAPLAAQGLMVGESLASSISGGMGLSVHCAEDAPFIDPAQAAAAVAGTYYGDLQLRQFELACALWPRGDLPADFKEPVQSDLPVLLLSGEADPVTPPENGDRVAQTLPNSLHLVAPGQGHNVILRGCLPTVAKDFIEQGSVAALDTACVQAIEAAPFFVDFTGPKP
jgi:pimeloyl-ACP methyl ester carboxylesterase